MSAATVNELQKELATLPTKRLLELCTRLAKYKKENKELLTYMLFEAHDEEAFIAKTKEETDAQFLDMNKSNLYLAKKSLRKILRIINKNIKYSGKKQTEVELRIHYCKKLKDSGIRYDGSPVLLNLYNNQIVKINSALLTLHEDLQLDFQNELLKLI